MTVADPSDANARRYLRSSYAKVGNILLKRGKATAALVNFHRALDADETQSAADRMDVKARSDVAAYSSRIGGTYEAIAASGPVLKRQENWQRARSWYKKSLNVWLELPQRSGVALREDGESPEKSVQGMARCDAALAKLKVYPPI